MEEQQSHENDENAVYKVQDEEEEQPAEQLN